MSRWSTPNKSYRKFKESYISLDDAYRPDKAVKAPRKERRKKPLYSALSSSSYEYTFPSAVDQTRHVSREARDLHYSPRASKIERRDEFEPMVREVIDEPDKNDMEFDIDHHRSSFHDRRHNIHSWTIQPTTTDHSLTTASSRNDLYSPPRLSRQAAPRDEIFHPSSQMEDNHENHYQTEAHYLVQKRRAIQRPRIPLEFEYHETIGHRSLNIHRLRLPSQYLHLLDKIVSGCEDHANNLASGWNTDLYSLTKQDIPLREAPKVYDFARPIMCYVKKVASILYSVRGLKCDRNQPHVLKYEGNHQGVELHHDKCDITVNLMMSRSYTYSGGGTYFPDARTNVRLEFGEFLLHPGCCVHAGSNITSGTRYLMVIFANEKK